MKDFSLFGQKDVPWLVLYITISDLEFKKSWSLPVGNGSCRLQFELRQAFWSWNLFEMVSAVYFPFTPQPTSAFLSVLPLKFSLRSLKWPNSHQVSWMLFQSFSYSIFLKHLTLLPIPSLKWHSLGSSLELLFSHLWLFLLAQ